MSTTVKGELKGLDTKDTCEFVRQVRKYSYRVKASGGGTLRFKIEHFTGDELGIGADYVKGKWITIEDRSKIKSGNTCTGSFDLPITHNLDDRGSVKLIFSRGLGTKGVDYEFFMEPA
ncbi:MAG: hypothetical protein AAGF01_15935 [Cyanobacteria bacterium P01_G01_bin.38]